MKLKHTTDGYHKHYYYVNGKRVRKDVWDSVYEENKPFVYAGYRKNSLWHSEFRKD